MKYYEKMLYNIIYFYTALYISSKMKASNGYSTQTRVSKFQKNVIRSAINDLHTNHTYYETDKVIHNDDNCDENYEYGKHTSQYNQKKSELTPYEKLLKSIKDLQNNISQKTQELDKYTHNISIINKNAVNGYSNNVDSRNLHIFTTKLHTLQNQLNDLNKELDAKIEEKKFIDFVPINIDKLYYQISTKKQQLYSLKNKEKLYKKKKNDNENQNNIQKLINEIDDLTKKINEDINKNKAGKLNKKYYYNLLADINKYSSLPYFKKNKLDDNQIFYLFCNNFDNFNCDEYYFYVKNNSKFLQLKQEYKFTNISKLTNIIIKNNKFETDDDNDW